MIRTKDLEEWLNHPATKGLLELMQEHRNASFAMISEAMLGVPSISDLDLCKIAEYRGQVNTLDLILDVTSFLDELLDKPRGSTHEEVYTAGTKYSN